MADQFGAFGIPGFQAESVTTENQFLWGSSDELLMQKPAVILSSSVDAGSTPTTQLRAGLLMGQITSTGKFKQYDPAATDGSQFCAGVLRTNLNMLDTDGTAVDRVVPGGIVVFGFAIKSKLFGFDALARRQLTGRIYCDDDLIGLPGDYRQVIAKVANYTVVTDTDNGVIFTTRGNAAPLTFTLPASITRGQQFTFFNEVDQNMLVTGAANTLVCFNNAAATTVALQTAGNKIGSGFRVTVNDNATKWLIWPIGAGTVTIT
jgi:hypothetical protein